jgi:NTE family protein/lysophospholipid hydrolase
MPSQHDPATSSLEVLRSIPLFAGFAPGLFETIEREFEWLSFDQEEVLFSEGEEADRLFIVVHGRLAISRRDAQGRAIRVGLAGPGESVGELGLLEGHRRAATVQALRASVAVMLSREKYEALTARVPECLVLLNRLLAGQLRNVLKATPDPNKSAEILAIVAASNDAPLALFCARLCDCLGKDGPVLHLNPARVKELLGEDVKGETLSVESRGRLLAWLDEQETRYRFIVLEADLEETAWTDRCIRQGEQIIFVARASARPGEHRIPESLRPAPQARIERLHQLVLIQDDNAAGPSGTKSWLDALPVSEHHHVRFGVPGDMDRLGRFLRGTSISLALAGGAALGFAHIGVLRALSEAGIPIDLVCGTSMGSIIGGQVALGMNWQDIQRVTRKHFRGNSVYDYALPAISFCKAKRMDARLQEITGNAMIEDLWLKYFCVSSNLTQARPEVHAQGGLKRAMRASSAVPGLFPPIRSQSGDLLADGAMVDNLPAGLAAARTGGAVIAVNVIPTVDRAIGTYKEGASAFEVLRSRLLDNEQERSPIIFDLLMRTAFLSAVGAAERSRTEASLYIEPELEAFSLLNTNRFDEIVEVGYRAALAGLANWNPKLGPTTVSQKSVSQKPVSQKTVSQT